MLFTVITFTLNAQTPVKQIEQELLSLNSILSGEASTIDCNQLLSYIKRDGWLEFNIDIPNSNFLTNIDVWEVEYHDTNAYYCVVQIDHYRTYMYRIENYTVSLIRRYQYSNLIENVWRDYIFTTPYDTCY